MIKFCSICYSKPSVARPVAAQTELTASHAYHIMHYDSLAQDFRPLLLYEQAESDITAEGKLAERKEERRRSWQRKGKREGEAGREKVSWQRKGKGGRFGEEESKGSSWVEERRLGEVLRSVRPI